MLNWLFRKKNSKLVAIVVPLSNRAELTASEKISMRHLLHYLGDYDKYIVSPRSLQVNFPDFGIKRFDNKFFGSAEAHSRLLLSPVFYKSFIDYNYILIYHLDSLVFSDQLTTWCEMDYDFIGPPWIKHENSPNTGMPMWENKVGNGGFSLRNIQSFLKVIWSRELSVDPNEYWNKNHTDKPRNIRYLNIHKKFLMRFRQFNNARYELSRYRFPEESFWANRAIHYYPQFNIPSVEQALNFGFESVPRHCFEKNNYVMPFGCHAWEKYDKAFWEPYLLD